MFNSQFTLKSTRLFSFCRPFYICISSFCNLRYVVKIFLAIVSFSKWTSKTEVRIPPKCLRIICDRALFSQNLCLILTSYEMTQNVLLLGLNFFGTNQHWILSEIKIWECTSNAISKLTKISSLTYYVVPNLKQFNLSTYLRGNNSSILINLKENLAERAPIESELAEQTSKISGRRISHVERIHGYRKTASLLYLRLGIKGRLDSETKKKFSSMMYWSPICSIPTSQEGS